MYNKPAPEAGLLFVWFSRIVGAVFLVAPCVIFGMAADICSQCKWTRVKSLFVPKFEGKRVDGMMFSKVVGVALLLLVSVVSQASEWELARDRDGIKVWTRNEPGYPIRAFKAVTTVDSSLSGLVSLIMDTGRVTDWAYRILGVDVLARDDDAATFVIYTKTDFPWPLSNRDVVLAGQVMQDEKTKQVTIRSRSTPAGQYPKNPDFLRMPDMVGDWIFRPLGAGKVEVTMIGRANPSGNIPFGVVNLIIHETPYRTLQGLRRVIGAERYQRTQLKQIKELQD